MSLMERCMREALLEAEQALAAGEVPVGAIVAVGDRIVGRGHNLREQDQDPTAHAEILAIRQAAQTLGRWRLADCTLYVTLEPCPMCAGAIAMARMEQVWFGAPDPRAGCCGSLYRITEDPAFLSPVPAHGGLLAEACAALLTTFFGERRKDR